MSYCESCNRPSGGEQLCAQCEKKAELDADHRDKILLILEKIESAITELDDADESGAYQSSISEFDETLTGLHREINKAPEWKCGFCGKISFGGSKCQRCGWKRVK